MILIPPSCAAVKASPMWGKWTEAGLSQQQFVQFIHRLKAPAPRPAPLRLSSHAGGPTHFPSSV
jgi:hypothetical protein